MPHRRHQLILIAFCCSLVCSPGLAQGVKRQSLDGVWSFRTDPYGQGEKLAWFHADLDPATWDSLAVPGNWDLKNEYADYAGDAWYTRTFTLAPSTDGQQVRLVFQSVYHDAKIWLNGQLLGENHLGFLPFHFDLTKQLKFGGVNRLTVKVNNVFKRGAIWNWGGIRRPVWLEITPLTRLEFQHLNAVPDLQTGEASISTKIVCSNADQVPHNVRIGLRITRAGKVIADDVIQTRIPANTPRHQVNWTHHLPKAKVALWQMDFPNLYESQITLYAGDRELHTLTDRFGIRKLEVKDTQLLLNGESIRPVGFNLVPEDRFTGNTLPWARIKEDVDLLKSCGANMARLSHLSLPKEFLDYLDEKGILVFEEVGLWGKDAWVDPNHPMPKAWLQRMIEEKYNHPCVVGWSVGNEIGDETKNPQVKAYVKGAIQMAKQLDPQRLAVYVSHTAQRNPDDAIVYSDLAMINVYGGWGAGIDRAWAYHRKPIFVTEFGDALNAEDPNLGTIPIAKMLNQLRSKDYVLGASLWTLNDYRSTYYGQPGWITPPSQNRAWGIVTTFRDKKRAFYAVQKEYAPVKRLAFSAINLSETSATVTIEPREKLDIPANVLRGYHLHLQVLDQAFATIAVQDLPLPVIYPGDEPFSVKIPWSPQVGVEHLRLELLDPQGYAVWQEIKHLSPPPPPVVRFANTASNGVRLYFDPTPAATEYLVRYQHGDSVYTTPKTINAFVDIEDERVKPGAVWSYQLIASNAAGESPPSAELKLQKDEDELPPMIWGTKRVGDDVYIAYSVSPYDYLYELEYGTQPGLYTAQFATKLKGVLHLKSVVPGQALYFRMRVRKQWGFASEWTPEYQVITP